MAKKKAAKKKAKRKDDGEFFAAVSNPEAVRHSVLETRRAVLESMRNFKELREIRKHKIHEKTHLRKNLRQVSALLTKIKSALPKVKLPAGDVMEMGEAAPEAAAAPAATHHKELGRIENELADIDRQLSGL
jgi:hypothetical protein